MRDWNVLATMREHHFAQGLRLLRPYGAVEKTNYFDVVVLRVDDPREFLQRIHEELMERPWVADVLGRIAPCFATFGFQTPLEFEARARELIPQLLTALAGKTFHVRMHRRGFKGRMHSAAEERFLDQELLTALDRMGAPGQITFDDPDAIVALDTVDTRAGIGVWTREEQARYPLLHLD
jgi:tRNA(Ser,Leu) C12 N-acetylase TAN1